MKQHPLLLTGPMVRARRAGHKTQTRRIATKQNCPGGEPIYRPGDVVWFRETFMLECGGDTGYFPAIPGSGYPYKNIFADDDDEDAPGEIVDRLVPHYRATEPDCELFGTGNKKNPEELLGWTPSIFMPRWACRDAPPVVSCRVERLQEITREDAIAEGIETYTLSTGRDMYRDYSGPDPVFGTDPIWSYRTLWDSINAKRPDCSWQDNPLVVVIEVEPFQEDGK